MNNWRDAFRDRRFRVEAAVTVFALVLTLAGLERFLDGVERRQGVLLPDPLLAAFQPVDVTWLTFTLIYAGVVVGLVNLSRAPRLLVMTLQAYIIMALVRIVAMLLTPLDPPPLAISLMDPVVQFFGTGKVLTRDLFFSGHTATLFLLFLTAPVGATRRFFLLCTIVVGTSVLLQHVHYTIDVFAGPFFAYGSFRLALLFSNRISSSP
jgi:hypothetical protein